jgi:small subunit ribosomal protein S8
VQTDPISDLLTRVRNAGHARLTRVTLPESRMKREIVRVLADHGYVRGFSSDGDPKKPQLTVELRYTAENQPIIERIERVSKPSRRVYVGTDEVPRVRHGIGLAILSTPRGILSDQQARDAHVGGEVLLRVW